MRFAIPMVWRELNNNVDVRYFCALHLKGINSKNLLTLVYGNPVSAIRQVSHGKELPARIFSVLPQITLPTTKKIHHLKMT